jgi:uncharacterized repeat protein (TIGR03803 family)
MAIAGLLFFPLFLVATSADAYTYSVLYTFTGGADGGVPIAGLTRDASGNLYGTTQTGGTSGAGVVFKLNSGGEETVLHSFTGGADGGYPQQNDSLLLDKFGNLYGTTVGGGLTGSGCFEGTCGVVFELSAIGQERVLHRFTGGVDGGSPLAGLVRNAEGVFYGSTYQGGVAAAGVVFKLTPAGTEHVLHSFRGLDGVAPQGTLIRDRGGNLYGIVTNGPQAGAIFKMSHAGKVTLVYTFTGGDDGGNPDGPLVRDTEGNLYGIAQAGGTFGNGVVFKVDGSGKETVLHPFAGGADGETPTPGLMRDVAGNLYGTTLFGGTLGNGVIFKVSPTGKETIIYTFTGGPDGGVPAYVTLISDSAGNLYGTTSAGGTFGNGVVFKLTLP